MDQALTRHILEVVLAGYWDWNIPDNQMYLSPAFKEMFGYDDHELPNSVETWQRLMFPDDLISVSESFDRHVRSLGAIAHRNEIRYRHKNGSIVWVDCSGQVIEWDEFNNPLRMIGCHIDITQKKTIEEKLQKSETHLRSAQRIGKLGSWEYVPKTGQIIWSEEVFRIFGLDQTKGEPSYEVLQGLLHPDDREHHNQILEKAIALGEPFDLECRMLRSDGEFVYLKSRGEIIASSDNTVPHLLGTLLDITDLKQSELNMLKTQAQLEASNHELEAFAYSVSHDLRAPLRAINGFSNALLEDYGHCFDRQAKDYFDRIQKNVDRMESLINNLLRLSRVSRSEMKYEPVDLSQLVRQQLEDLREAEPDRSVEFIVTPNVVVLCDCTLMQMVISNLLQNAWKFTSHCPQAHIEFGIIQEASHPPICFVRDNGAGFDMTYSKQLFGIFQRLHDADEFPGTGIGLATVQRAIQRHGGRVWAEGAVGRGATVYFTLPKSLLDYGAVNGQIRSEF